MLRVDSRNVNSLNWYLNVGFSTVSTERFFLFENPEGNDFIQHPPIVKSSTHFSLFGFSSLNFNGVELGVINGGLISVCQSEFHLALEFLVKLNPKRILIKGGDSLALNSNLPSKFKVVLDFNVFCLLKK